MSNTDTPCAVCAAHGIDTPATLTDFPVVGDERDVRADTIHLCPECYRMGQHYPATAKDD